MKPWKLVALLLVVALTSAAIAFWFGLREGWNVGIMADSIPRGGISLHHIQKLSGGTVTRNTMTSLESDVDMALLWAYHLEHHPLRPILNTAWGKELLLNEASLRRLADYRKSHPSPLRPEALAADSSPNDKYAKEMGESLLEGAQETQRMINETVSRYATR